MTSPRRNTLLPALMLLLVASTACASGGSSDGPPRGSNTLIIQAELEPLASLNAYEAIQRLRPQWLQLRSTEQPVVFLDGSRMGGLEALRGIDAGSVLEIRRRSGRDATTRYGTGFGGGTIEVRTR